MQTELLFKQPQRNCFMDLRSLPPNHLIQIVCKFTYNFTEYQIIICKFTREREREPFHCFV